MTVKFSAGGYRRDMPGSASSTDASSDPGLRERKKRATRQRLQQIARELFLARGFEAVTVAEIARHAEVAEKTVFNYFPTKEDLIYSGMSDWEQELLAAIRNRAPGESALTAFHRFIREPSGLVAGTGQDREILAGLTRLIGDTPALLAREAQTIETYTASLGVLLADELGADETDPRPWIAAIAMMGVHRSLLGHVRRRIAEGAALSRIAAETRDLADAGCELLAAGLSDVAVRPPEHDR